MTRQDIIDMIAKVYGVVWTNEAQLKDLERFAALVASAEREACAKLCDVLAVHPEYASEVTKLAALAIRARGQA